NFLHFIIFFRKFIKNLPNCQNYEKIEDIYHVEGLL
ncbi:hypothetical protein M057_10560, partial [Streptococcus pneumoniae 1779n23_04]